MYKHINYLINKNKWYHIPKMRILSVDMSSATDRIPIKFIIILWKYIFKNYPNKYLRCYEHLVWCDRRIEPAHPKGMASFILKSGSLMGEPLSFLTLTLYNLVAYTLSKQCLAQQKDLKDLKRLEPISGHYVAICGDDMIVITLRGLRRYLAQVYKALSAILSKGKDHECISHGTFCECHIYMEYKNKKYKIFYVDSLKLRLLTPACRVHRDGRASVIGRGQYLSKVISWISYENTRKYARICMFDLYRIRIEKGMFVPVPIELPPNLGGISFPLRPLQETVNLYPALFSAFDQICKSDLYTRALWAYSLIRLTSRRSRAIPEVDPYDILKKFTSNNEVIDLKIKNSISYTLENIPKNKVFTSYSIIQLVKRYCLEEKVEIPTYDGLPSYRFLNEQAEKLGFIPIEKVLSNSQRITNFYSLMTTEAKPSNKVVLNFPKYIGKFHKLIKLMIKEFPYKRLDHEPNVSYYEKQMRLSLSFMIYKDDERLNLFKLGPSLLIPMSERAVYYALPVLTDTLNNLALSLDDKFLFDKIEPEVIQELYYTSIRSGGIYDFGHLMRMYLCVIKPNRGKEHPWTHVPNLKISLQRLLRGKGLSTSWVLDPKTFRLRLDNKSENN
jgi:hypothetical protein